MRRNLLTVLLVMSFSLTACSANSTQASDASANASDSQRLIHIDGKVVVDDDAQTLTLQPEGESDAITLELGPEIERSTLKAAQVTHARVRVYYRPSEEIAVSVHDAPRISAQAESFEGEIAAVSETELTLVGRGGERRFVIRTEDATSFDIPHLEEHLADRSPVRVYYKTISDTDYALAVEDAV